MSTYPASLDDLGASNPSSSTQMDDGAGHAAQHADANDAIDAIQVTLGADPFGVTLLPDPTGADDDDVATISSGAWVIAPPTGGGGGGVSYVTDAAFTVTRTSSGEVSAMTGPSFTPVSGRLYRISARIGQVKKTTGNGNIYLRLRKDNTSGTLLEQACWSSWTTNAYIPGWISVLMSGATLGGTTFAPCLTVETNTNGAVFSNSDSDSGGGYLLVEDIGAS